MSRITAPVGEVTTPITFGMYGNGCLRSRSNSPSAGQHGLPLLEQRHQRAFAGQFHAIDDDLVFAAPGIGGELAGDDHFDAVLRLERDRAWRRRPPDHAVDHRIRVLERRDRHGPTPPASAEISPRSRTWPKLAFDHPLQCQR